MTRLLCVTLLVASTAAFAANKPNPYLGQAKVFYQGLEYEKCLARLDQAMKWNNEPNEEVEVQLYAGLCSFNIGNMDDAKRRFELAIRLDPDVALPAYTSPRIVEMFDSSKKRLALKSRKTVEEPVVKKEEPAKKEETKVAVVDTPKKVDLTPTPKEQTPELVEEGKSGPNLTAPIAFGTAGALAAGAGAFLGMQAKSAETTANSARFESDAFAATQTAQNSARNANIAFAVAGAAVVGAVISYVIAN